jgi:hypothetical protein
MVLRPSDGGSFPFPSLLLHRPRRSGRGCWTRAAGGTGPPPCSSPPVGGGPWWLTAGHTHIMWAAYESLGVIIAARPLVLTPDDLAWCGAACATMILHGKTADRILPAAWKISVWWDSNPPSGDAHVGKHTERVKERKSKVCAVVCQGGGRREWCRRCWRRGRGPTCRTMKAPRHSCSSQVQPCDTVHP